MAGPKDLAERIESALQVAGLLSKARGAVKQGNLAAARQFVDNAVSLEPDNEESLKLQYEIDSEARRREEAEIARLNQRRDEAIAELTTRVRAHLNAQQFDQAGQLVHDALDRYPGDLVLEALGSAVETTRRRYGGQRTSPERSRPALPYAAEVHQGQARSLPVWLYPAAGIGLVILAVAGRGIFTGSRNEVRQEQPGSTRTAAKGRGASDTSVLENALVLAIQSRSWGEANLWLNRLVQLRPGDPRIQGWMQEIDEGSAKDRQLASLRTDTQQAIMTRSWGEAESKLAALLEALPGDPDAIELKRQVSAARKEDAAASDMANRTRRVAALRVAIPAALEAKRWNEAQQRIAELQGLTPGDSEVAAWQRALAVLRLADAKKTQPVPAGPAAAAASGVMPGVTPKPVVESFSVAPVILEKGRLAMLRWSVTNATGISIDHEVGPVQSAASYQYVKPEETTTYTLSAYGAGGSATATVTVAVNAPAAAPAGGEESVSPGEKVSPAGPTITSRPAAPETLNSRLRAVAGRWEFQNQEIPKPEKTETGRAYTARKISLALTADGNGDLSYDLGTDDHENWPLHSARTSLRIRFKLTAWDGHRLTGSSRARDYAIGVEPVDGTLKVDWSALKPTDLRDGQRVVGGTGLLVRSGASAKK